jgi:tetratricopeptide (TPR) repeat protein
VGLLFVIGLRAQDVASDLPAEPPLSGLERIRAGDQRSEADSDRLVAQVHYLQARLALGRGDKSAALGHYQRAWQWDPQQGALLAEIVELAVQLRRNDEAARYALLADDQDVPDPLLLRRLATHLTERRDWAGAIRLYERAQRLQERRDPNEEKPDLGAVILRREMGRLYFLDGQFGKSAEAFAFVRGALEDSNSGLSDDARKLVLDDPAKTYSLWAEAFLAADRLDDAVDLFTKSHADKGNSALLAYHLARVAAKRNNSAAAEAKLNEYFAAKSDAGGGEPYQLLAELFSREAGDSAAARKRTIVRLEELAALDEKNQALKQALADQYFAAEHWERAEGLLAGLAAERPGRQTAEPLAEIYRRTNRPEKLLALIIQVTNDAGTLDSLGTARPAIAADKALVKRLAELARAQPAKPESALYAAGLLALEASEFDLAEELLAAAAERQSRKEAVYLRWGLGMLLAQQPARAAKVFQRMLDEQVNPDDEAETLFYLSTALALADRGDEALAAARQAAELNRGDVRIAARVGWVLQHAQRLEEAKAAYLDFLARFDSRHASLNTRDAVKDARLALSSIDLERGDHAAATEWLEQVLAEFPGDIGAGNDLGYLWADRGVHLQRSLSLIERAVQSAPDNPAYRDSLGWVYFRLGRHEEAERELAKAAASEGADGVILEHWGEALQKLGRRDQALTAFRRAEAIFQAADDAKRLEKLRQRLDKSETSR